MLRRPLAYRKIPTGFCPPRLLLRLGEPLEEEPGGQLFGRCRATHRDTGAVDIEHRLGRRVRQRRHLPVETRSSRHRALDMRDTRGRREKKQHFPGAKIAQSLTALKRQFQRPIDDQLPQHQERLAHLGRVQRICPLLFVDKTPAQPEDHRRQMAGIRRQHPPQAAATPVFAERNGLGPTAQRDKSRPILRWSMMAQFAQPIGIVIKQLQRAIGRQGDLHSVKTILRQKVAIIILPRLRR